MEIKIKIDEEYSDKECSPFITFCRLMHKLGGKNKWLNDSEVSFTFENLQCLDTELNKLVDSFTPVVEVKKQEPPCMEYTGFTKTYNRVLKNFGAEVEEECTVIFNVNVSHIGDNFKEELNKIYTEALEIIESDNELKENSSCIIRLHYNGKSTDIDCDDFEIPEDIGNWLKAGTPESVPKPRLKLTHPFFTLFDAF